MAVVWLAHDLKHDRHVAIKVLRPELSAVIGAERFRREIRVTAALQHTNILPLHDSGECDGFLYYVMPFVEGETLSARLARDGALSQDEALRLTGEIGGALGHAHRHGIVHRDLKPENVLLADGHALVADFGIAHASGGERLTETGLSLGTPAYMSPEQGAGDRADERSDQYALGAVTYEMLAGEPPFTGPTAQSVMAKHVAQPAPSIRTTRPAIPAHVDAALQRAMAKQPADRFSTVGEFVDALVHAPSGPTTQVGRVRGRRARRATLILAGVSGLLVLAAVAGRWLGAPTTGGTVRDPNAVAVIPFRTDGADRSLEYVGEGMVDLLAVKLPGGTGVRALAPRATLAAWRSESGRGGDDPARAVARRLGAGLVLDGSVIGSPTRMTLSATLRDADRGGIMGTSEVIGPADSLPALVDRLVIALLARRSGVSTQQLAGLTSLPALRAYLAGLASHRAGRYGEAVQHFEVALREDSTFALAALAALPSMWRATEGRDVDAVTMRALRLGNRLHGADSLMLLAYAGDSVRERTMLDLIADWERVVAGAPDRAEAWFELGDRQLHDGLVNGYPDALARAKRSLDRSLALDSSLAIAVDHLLLLALHEDDTAAAARLAPLYRRTGGRGEWAGSFEWIMAVMSHDSAAVQRVRERFPTYTTGSLFRIAGLAQLDGGSIEDALLALRETARRASTVVQVGATERRLRAALLNGGHPDEAEQATQRLAGTGVPSVLLDVQRAFAADFWDGDTAAGSAARARLRRAPPGARWNTDGPGFSACADGLHGIAIRDAAATRRGLQRLRALLPAQPLHSNMDDDRRLCAAVLDAAVAASERPADSRELLVRADSIQLFSLTVNWSYYPVVMAMLYDAIGEPKEALRLLRRRFVGGTDGADEVAMLSTTLRQEGRIAESIGDRDGAVRAYRRYLAFRADPDPSLVPQRDSVHASLAALLGEPRADLATDR